MSTPATGRGDDEVPAPLAGECDRFARYLIGRPPSSYVVAWYARGLRARPESFEPRPGLDRTLWALASSRRAPLRGLDLAARLWCPSAALRRRLVLLLAILESAPGTCERYERPSGGRAAFALGLMGRSLRSAAALGLALPLIGLARILAPARRNAS